MPLIQFDTDDRQFESCTIYKTQEEWDANIYSEKSYRAERDAVTLQQRRYRGPIERARNEPYRFPCIAIQGALIRNSDGPDEYAYTFIYDYTEVPVEVEQTPPAKVSATRRSVEVFRNATWVSCSLVDVKAGDKFRMFDEGAAVCDLDGTSEWVAEEDAFVPYAGSPSCVKVLPTKHN